MKSNKGITLILLVTIIVLVLIICGVTIFIFINKKDNNSTTTQNTVQESETTQTNGEFFNGDYSLVYDVSDYKDSFWNTKDKYGMTNEEKFFNKYMFQVSEKSSATYGGNLAMPLKPNYTMYYMDDNPSSNKGSTDYFLKIDFNKENVFYPNRVIGTLDGISGKVFAFYILDNDMNFNRVSMILYRNRESAKEVNDASDYEIAYEDDEWTFLNFSKNRTKTYVNASYYLNSEKDDYINFGIELNGKLKDEDVKELVDKIKNNVKIDKIEDESTCNYIEGLDPYYYLKLNSKDEKIKLNDDFTLNMEDADVKMWISSEDNTYMQRLTSTKSINVLEWYDKKWKDGSNSTKLIEYPDGLESGIENIANTRYGENIELKDYSYNNIDVKLVYGTTTFKYVEENGYSNLIGIIFESDNDLYSIESKQYLKEEEIPSYIQYLFDNIILTNK